MPKEYNTIEMLQLCKDEGKEMRCPYYGKHCGLIISYDGNGYHYRGMNTYIDLRFELDWNTKWVIER